MCILETNPLLITSVANTLPYSKGCLFILFFYFLCYAKAFKFIRSNVFIFLFIFITVGDGSKKIILFSSVTQLCPTLCNPMECSMPGFSVPGAFPGQNTRARCYFLLQGIIPTQGSNLGLLHCGLILYRLSHQASPSC